MIRKYLPAAAFALVLSGCVSIGGDKDVPDQLITFTPTEKVAPGDAAAGPVREAIVVYEPEVEDRLDVNRVPVAVGATGVAYLKNATYVERPARLFRHLLAETLRARSGRLVIEGENPGVESQTRIQGRLIEAGYDADAAAVTVTYDAILILPDGTIRQRRFSETETAVPAKAAFVAPALNKAANAVVAEVADWLTGTAG